MIKASKELIKKNDHNIQNMNICPNHVNGRQHVPRPNLANMRQQTKSLNMVTKVKH